MIPGEGPPESRSAPATQCAVGEMDSQSATGQLLAAALAGDRDAWARIVEDYSNLLWWIARSHRLDDASAADVVQTVWLQLVRFGHRVQDPDRLPSWLATTARREAQRRLSSRDIPSGWIQEEIDRTLPAVDERLIDEETIGGVLAAFANLSADDQRLLRLVCEVPAKSYEEIASLLGKPQGYIGPT